MGSLAYLLTVEKPLAFHIQSSANRLINLDILGSQSMIGGLNPSYLIRFLLDSMRIKH